MQYHPSQQIPQQHEALFSSAILKSLMSTNLMLGDLPEAKCFESELLTQATHQTPSTLHFGQKLGHLYEDALLTLLESSPRFKVIANNFQIITEQRRTLGELDFLLLDSKTNSHIHLELAVKFYLIVINGDEVRYPGPDARDNYQRKVARLRDHQLTLTTHPEVQGIISPLINGATVTPQHLVHGIFFDHIKAKQRPLPDKASPNANRRKWLYCQEFSHHFAYVKSVRVLPKQLWLCEIDHSLFQALVEVPVAELIELGQQRCTMFVIHAGEEPKFLAPDSWPNIH